MALYEAMPRLKEKVGADVAAYAARAWMRMGDVDNAVSVVSEALVNRKVKMMTEEERAAVIGVADDLLGLPVEKCTYKYCLLFIGYWILDMSVCWFYVVTLWYYMLGFCFVYWIILDFCFFYLSHVGFLLCFFDSYCTFALLLVSC